MRLPMAHVNFFFPCSWSASRSEPTMSFPSWYTIMPGTRIHSLRAPISPISNRARAHAPIRDDVVEDERVEVVVPDGAEAAVVLLRPV
jgi:hypothetical protein